MQIEIRSDNLAVITGYVNVVERESRVLRDAAGQFVEIVQSGAFARSMERSPEVGLRFDHGRQLGTTNDVLKLKEDAIGLYAEAQVSDQEVIAKARNGELRGWSFGFNAKDATWTQRADGMRLRTLTDIDLIEVSILDVTPAYIATSIEARDGDQHLKEYRYYSENINLVDNSAPVEQEEQRKEPTVDMDLLKRKFEILTLG